MDITVTPNPFSPDGDGRDDVTLISGRLASSSARIKILIFDIIGRLIRTLEDNRFSGNNFSLVWDGKDENGQPARIGIYVIYLQMLNDRQGTLAEMKTTVILARKL
jgi:flagellar hook assembly protein FlgD